MFISNRRVLYFALVLFIAMVILFLTNVPDRLASNAGYDGAMQMFALDRNVPGFPHYRAPYQMIESYCDIGRQQLVMNHVLFDFLFPAVYVLLFLSAFSLLARGFGNPARWWSRIGVALAFTAGVADWAENVGIITLVYTFRNPLGWVEEVTTFLTIIKWTASIGAVVLVIGTTWRRWRSNSAASP